jgi:uncharacterized coiled-coil DUF342 family protein
MENIIFISCSAWESRSYKTLSKKSFVFLWQTSSDLNDFESRIDNLREKNEGFHVEMKSLVNRAQKYRVERDIPLKELSYHKEEKSCDWEGLRKYAKELL